MSGARIVGVGIAASVLFLGLGGSALPTELKPRLPHTASPLAQPYTPQLIKDDPDRPAGGVKAAAPSRTAGGLPASGTKGSSGTQTQEEFADRARDTYVPPPPSTPGIDQDTLDAIRDAAEKDVPVQEGVNGSPSGTGE